MSGYVKKAGALAKVPLTFLLVMGVLLLALGWLGWLLLDQDRSLQQQRTRDRVDSAAKRLSNALELRADEEQSGLEALAQALGSASSTEIEVLLHSRKEPGLSVHFAMDSMIVVPRNDLRYIPVENKGNSTSEAFNQSDRLEFQQGNLIEAIELLESLAESPDREIQAGSLLRLGRINFRSGEISRALEEYGRLAEFEDQLIENVPVQWLAHYARCKIFSAENDKKSLLAELSVLSPLLAKGGSRVSKSTYRFYALAVNTWAEVFARLPENLPVSVSHGVSDAVVELHFIWTERLQGRGNPVGIRIVGEGPDSLILMWKSMETGLLGRVIDLKDLNTSGLLQTIGNLQAEGLGWSISAPDGRRFLAVNSDPAAASSLVSLSIGDSPLVVQTYETAELVPIPEDIQRRQLLLAGLAVVLIVIVTSTYSISRALRREAEMAELQADFVSAVSHEFRTPLTSIRQLLELLASGRIHEPQKVGDYYRILDRESARLQRMVEDLLDFQRMESNVRPYQPETLRVGSLLEEITAAFREEYGLSEKALVLDATRARHVRMDRESLTRAIWNLLDNAVKYSEGEPAVTVTAGQQEDMILIAVTDRGAGISKEEQARVFRKFVRGSAAKLTRVKGTGLGLAMVRKTLEDQGATIDLQSAPGRGSTFTIVIEAEGPE